MAEKITQQQLNDQQWHDAANWSGPAFIALYFSKRDSRLWVPKRVPALGWTLNLGHRHGPVWLMVILVGPVLLMTMSLIVAAVMG